MDDLPNLLPSDQIRVRLEQIFPDGTPNRSYCVRDLAARTVFVMLYIGAIQGTGRWLRPDQVTRMTDAQAAQPAAADRLSWSEISLKSTRIAIPGRWYAVNTREPIRDETLRGGLLLTGAAVAREGIPTTSPLPRYALEPAFAALFDPALQGQALEQQIADWQRTHLTAGALARIQVIRRTAAQSDEDVLVTFPNRETRRLSSGASSIIAKAVIEEFAPRFLVQPAVVLVSESRYKIVARDSELAEAIGLRIKTEENLPDILLVDLGPHEPLLVFVEVVATGGPITPHRQQALLQIAREGGFSAGQVAFVTAYLDRTELVFRQTIPELAWRSFAWFLSEPDHILYLHEGRETHRKHLHEFMDGR